MEELTKQQEDFVLEQCREKEEMLRITKNFDEKEQAREKEFNLSDKMKKWVQPIDKEIKDVKEFIKRLKEELNIIDEINPKLARMSNEGMNLIIDKLAGEKLICS